MYELLVVDDDGRVELRQEYAMWTSAAIDAEYYEKAGYTDISITTEN